MPEISADLQSLLDRVAEGAARASGAYDGTVRLIEGDHLRRVAHFGPVSMAEAVTPIRSSSVGGIAQAVRERRTIHTPDARTLPSGAGLRRQSESLGLRTILCTPMLLNDRVLGGIVIRRTEVQPFSDEEIGQLETYAALAAVAIDRARLAHDLAKSNG